MYIYSRTGETLRLSTVEEVKEQLLKDLLNGYMLRNDYYTVRVNDKYENYVDLVLKYPFNKLETITMSISEFKQHDKYEKIMTDSFNKYVCKEN